MKNLVKLNGAKALSKKEQKSINGGHNCEKFVKHCTLNGVRWNCCDSYCSSNFTGVCVP